MATRRRAAHSLFFSSVFSSFLKHNNLGNYFSTFSTMARQTGSCGKHDPQHLTSPCPPAPRLLPRPLFRSVLHHTSLEPTSIAKGSMLLRRWRLACQEQREKVPAVSLSFNLKIKSTDWPIHLGWHLTSSTVIQVIFPSVDFDRGWQSLFIGQEYRNTRGTVPGKFWTVEIAKCGGCRNKLADRAKLTSNLTLSIQFARVSADASSRLRRTAGFLCIDFLT